MKTPEQIKAGLITVKLNQVNAAVEKHAAALMAYPALAAADTAARAAVRAAGGFNRAPVELINAARDAQAAREAGEKSINYTAAHVRRREREFHILNRAAA